MNLLDFSLFESFGEKKVIYLGGNIFDKNFNQKSVFLPDEEMIILLKAYSKEYLDNIIVGFIIEDRLGNKISGMNTAILKKEISLEKNKTYIFKIHFKLPNLTNGEYVISPAIAEGTQENHIQHHWVHNAFSMKIIGTDLKDTMGWFVNLDNKNIEVEINEL